MNVFDFEVPTHDGKLQSLSIYRGRVLLIVNVASKCGFTPQYAGLEELYKKYFDKGFEVLGFPCNQFLWQEPGDGQSCRVNYGVTFPVFGKIQVNGRHAHPLYQFLKSSCPGTLGTRFIKWNFTKFLVSRDGVPLQRFGTLTAPSTIESEIQKLD